MLAVVGTTLVLGPPRWSSAAGRSPLGVPATRQPTIPSTARGDREVLGFVLPPLWSLSAWFDQTWTSKEFEPLD